MRARFPCSFSPVPDVMPPSGDPDPGSPTFDSKVEEQREQHPSGSVGFLLLFAPASVSLSLHSSLFASTPPHLVPVLIHIRAANVH